MKLNIISTSSEVKQRTKISNELIRNFIKVIFDAVGYTLTEEIEAPLVSMANRILVVACAGSGKTSLVMVKAIILTILFPYVKGKQLQKNYILSLAYGAENVPQMQERYKMIRRKVVNTIKLPGVDIPEEINCRTFHSLSLFWIKEYNESLGLGKNTKSHLDETECLELVNTCVFVAKKYFPELDTQSAHQNALWDLYCLCIENFYVYEDILNRVDVIYDNIKETGLEPEVVVKIFTLLDATLAKRERIPFSYQLKIFHNMLQNPQVRERISNYYEVIIVDEVQDSTPIMRDIVRLICRPDTYLCQIGDDDQCIYAFKGADPKSILDFPKVYPDGEAFSLTYNRRCPKNIVELASSIISENKNRYPKNLKSEDRQGIIEYIPYLSEDEMIDGIISKIKKDNDFSNTAISYRNNICSIKIIRKLWESNIPFQLLGGIVFYKTDIFRDFGNVLDFIFYPATPSFWRWGYKIFNIKKSDWLKFVAYNKNKNRSDTHPNAKTWYDLDFSKFDFKGLPETVEYLKTLNSDTYVNEEFNRLYTLFNANFWYTKKMLSKVEYAEETEEYLKEFYKSPLKYYQLNKALSDMDSAMKQNKINGIGVSLSTFHKDKGLEFDKVHLTYLDDSIFPNYNSIDSKPFSEESKDRLKSTEVNLMYVAVTRAKKELYLWYNSLNPSRYIFDKVANTSVPDSMQQFGTIDLRSIVPSKSNFKSHTFKIE